MFNNFYEFLTIFMKSAVNKNKELFKNKTLMQDNVRFCHSKIVKEFAKENNIEMNYIPAYSPIFNPIEMSFSKIKSNYRINK